MSKTLIDSARFANSADGYEQLTAFARQWAQLRWAVEGCHGAGRSLAQRLTADGELVLDLPAKLAARVRVYSQGHGRKTIKHDAVSIGLAALEGTGILQVACDDVTTPGGMRRELTANKAPALLARIRSADDVTAVRLHIARDHLAGIRALDARLKYIAGQIAALVTASGTTLTSLFGVGPVIAGRILAEVGDIARFASKDEFASHNGTAPHPARRRPGLRRPGRKDDRLVGIEILDASSRPHPDLLEEAEILS